MKPMQLRRIAKVRALAANGTARRRREEAGISLREVAASLPVVPSTLHRWETGECAPRGAAALAWADILDALEPEKVAA